MAVTSFLDILQPFQAAPPQQQRSAPISSTAALQEKEYQENAAARAAELISEAEETLSQSRHRAAEVLEDAQVQAEALREAAWQEGFHDGREAGRIASEVELRREHDVQMGEWRDQAEALAQAICQTREEMWLAQEAEMVAFVLDIARQVVKTEVTQNPAVVTEVLHNALRRVTDKEHVRIRVSLPDAAGVRAMRDDLMNLMDGVKNLEIVDDRRIGQGGCVVETNAGTIDAKIETQLDEVERALSHAIER